MFDKREILCSKYKVPSSYKISVGQRLRCFDFRVQADPDKAMDLGISIESFTYCDNVRILKRSGLVEHPIHYVQLQDQKRRSLFLIVKVIVKPGGSLRVS